MYIPQSKTVLAQLDQHLQTKHNFVWPFQYHCDLVKKNPQKIIQTSMTLWVRNLMFYPSKLVSWCFTPSQPGQLYQGNFYPSKPVRLYISSNQTTMNRKSSEEVIISQSLKDFPFAFGTSWKESYLSQRARQTNSNTDRNTDWLDFFPVTAMIGQSSQKYQTKWLA